ncbi:hypothetical protein M406DRAFT_230823, partial [Cryphonectria parasitica EP155]
RASAPRKKACQACTVARARCDLVRPSCSRCVDRQIQCEYSTPAAAGARVQRAAWSSPPPAVSQEFAEPSSLLLLAPLDVSRIRDRWLDYYFTPTTKQIKEYPARIIALIARTLSAYPAMWIRNESHVPPFIHPAQCYHQEVMPEPLANCLSLLRLCQNAAVGSEELVRDSILRELSRLVAVVGEDVQDQTLRQHLWCLSALQAYLLLCLYSYAAVKTRPSLGIFGPDLISTLHGLASKVSAAGVLCLEELGGGPSTGTPPPRWESWIIAEAKRRTLFCAYMFEDVYNYEMQSATYLADELAPLLAPSSRWLWQARDRNSFEAEYADWTKAWSGQRGLAISELWPSEAKEDIDGAIMAQRAQETKDRISRWTEGVDEFGMLILAVCTATH